MINYKGYSGTVRFDDEAEVFHGEVLGLRDVVTFQGTTVEELKHAFRDSIDDYLDYCEERGEEPDKPFSGKFLMRLDPSLHRKLHELSAENGTSLNAWLTDKLAQVVKLEGRGQGGGAEHE